MSHANKEKEDFFEEGKKYKKKQKRLSIKNTNVTTQLNELETVFIISVLESLIEMLKVLSQSNDKPLVYKETTYITLEDRLGKFYQEPPLIDQETNAPVDLDSKDAKFRKIQKELAYLKGMITKTIEHLTLKGNYTALEDFVVFEIFKQMEEDELLLQEKKIQQTLVNIKADIVRQKELFDEKTLDLDQQLATMKDEVFRVLLTSNIEARYIDKWETARADQHFYQCARMENKLKETLAKVKLETDNETQAHKNIVNFLNQEIKRLGCECEAWLLKLKQESDKADVEIKHAKEVLEGLRKTKQETTDLFEFRQGQLLEREQEKERLRREEEMQVLRTAMARRIQGWWRAILLRRRLRALRRKAKPKGK
ncbi:Uncharacterized protein GBIM_05083 [Gryllus bimaculatus]|nr:Uncharacterized protein GBIM_05083 [Gryllus bimaculatus]